MKNVVILGSTGSIGTSALKVAEQHPDQMNVLALAAGTKVHLLAEQVRKTGAKYASIFDREKEAELKGLVGADVQVFSGMEGLLELVRLTEADMVLVSIIGTAGLKPTLAAIEAGKDIAVASKEILVMAGEVVMAAAKKRGVKLLPVDSEHNAIFQCLEGHNGGTEELSRLILTASGGPFRTWPEDQLKDITLAQALKHPTWEMGRKITIDSATLFNKGLEMIEAKFLFDTPMSKVDVIVHPQSIVHSMVEFVDGSVLAQLSQTDMCFPIQYAVTWPKRLKSGLKSLDFKTLGTLEFEEPRRDVFPAIDLAIQAGTQGGPLPAVLNAANEIAVQAFVDQRIGFCDIWRIVDQTMNQIEVSTCEGLEELICADAEARGIALSLI